MLVWELMWGDSRAETGASQVLEGSEGDGGCFEEHMGPLLPLGTEVTIWLKGPLPSLFWARTLNW